MTPCLDPARDLELTRYLKAAPEALWPLLTTGDGLGQWFAPAPAKVIAATVEPRPGGRFSVEIRLADGSIELFNACILCVEGPDDTAKGAPLRLILTTALAPGFRPANNPFVTLVFTFTKIASGTRATLVALHPSADIAAAHGAAGFQSSFARVLDQLDAAARAENAQ